MKISYRQAACDDVIRQFRYYLVTLNLPEIAVRFKDSVRRTVQSLSRHPQIGPHCASGTPELHSLRSWPVAGFEAIRVYYSVEGDSLRVIRILHGKRDIHSIFGKEEIR